MVLMRFYDSLFGLCWVVSGFSSVVVVVVVVVVVLFLESSGSVETSTRVCAYWSPCCCFPAFWILYRMQSRPSVEENRSSSPPRFCVPCLPFSSFHQTVLQNPVMHFDEHFHLRIGRKFQGGNGVRTKIMYSTSRSSSSSYASSSSMFMPLIPPYLAQDSGPLRVEKDCSIS